MPRVAAVITILILSGCTHTPPPDTGGTILTVNGEVPATQMGLTLIHEHVFLDWTGADSLQPEKWNTREAFEVILPHLRELSEHKVLTLFECTPDYLGRNPLLLRQLADSAHLNLVTNTGYYGAANDKYLPAHSIAETPDQLAQRWIREFENGIGNTDIRPGFIKIGVDSDSILSVQDEKLVRAAARTHLKTGLTIVSHTGPDAPAFAQLKILEEEGVSPDAWVWTHAQNGTSEGHCTAAGKGA